ncbi:transcription initiation factor IIB 2, partial [Candidatus Bathyarchaeota archaeon]|nr:transcription initiation factor IIB 2 [Candidatus Bathyarchaeota archaeon]
MLMIHSSNNSKNSKNIEKDILPGNQEITCPECGADEIITDTQRGEQICSQCGLVLSEHAINPEHERRAFTMEERKNRSRTGAPLTNL